MTLAIRRVLRQRMALSCAATGARACIWEAGEARWLSILEDQKKRIDLKAYADAHAGHLPDMPIAQKLASGWRDPRFAHYGFDLPSGGFGASAAEAISVHAPIDVTKSTKKKYKLARVA